MVLVVNHASGLEVEVGDADSIFDEKDFLRAVVVNMQGALFVPLGGILAAGRGVLQELDGHVRERPVAQVFGYVGEVAFGEADFSWLEPEGGWRLSGNFAGDRGWSQSYEEVIMMMAVQEGGRVWGDFDFKNPDPGVLKDLVMRGFGGDFYFGLGMERRARDGQQQAGEVDFHAANCSSRILLGGASWLARVSSMANSRQKLVDIVPVNHQGWHELLLIRRDYRTVSPGDRSHGFDCLIAKFIGLLHDGRRDRSVLDPFQDGRVFIEAQDFYLAGFVGFLDCPKNGWAVVVPQADQSGYIGTMSQNIRGIDS